MNRNMFMLFSVLMLSGLQVLPAGLRPSHYVPQENDGFYLLNEVTASLTDAESSNWTLVNRKGSTAADVKRAIDCMDSSLAGQLLTGTTVNSTEDVTRFVKNKQPKYFILLAQREGAELRQTRKNRNATVFATVFAGVCTAALRNWMRK